MSLFITLGCERQMTVFYLVILTLLAAIKISGNPVVHYGRSFAQSNFETAVRYYDKDLFHAALNTADRLNIHFRGFYHVTEDLKYWKEIFEEHLMIMDGKRFQSNLFSKDPSKAHVDKKRKIARLSTGWSSVFDAMDKIHITFEGSSEAFANLTSLLGSMHIRTGGEKIDVKHYDKVAKESTLAHLSAADRHSLAEVFGEMYTLNELHSYCTERSKAGDDAYVFYLHNHETNCTSSHQAAALRSATFVHDVVNSFVVEFPSVCLSALLGGYGTCGVDFEAGQYAHNVWWARCDHVVLLEAFDIEHIATTVGGGGGGNSPVVAAYAGFVHDFLYRAGGKRSRAPVARAGESGVRSESRESEAAGGLGDRCAYNFDSGAKDVITTTAHGTSSGGKVKQGYRFIGEDQCSRAGYRFGLIEVLSRLLDDRVLFNNRHDLPIVQTDFGHINVSSYSHRACAY